MAKGRDGSGDTGHGGARTREGGGGGGGKDDGRPAKSRRTCCSNEVPERNGLDVQLPLKVAAHPPFHLVDLPEGEHALPTVHQNLLE